MQNDARSERRHDRLADPRVLAKLTGDLPVPGSTPSTTFAVCDVPAAEPWLEGTPADWAELRNRAQAMRPFELSWWIDPLTAALDQFQSAAQMEHRERRAVRERPHPDVLPVS